MARRLAPTGIALISSAVGGALAHVVTVDDESHTSCNSSQPPDCANHRETKSNFVELGRMQQ